MRLLLQEDRCASIDDAVRTGKHFSQFQSAVALAHEEPCRIAIANQYVLMTIRIEVGHNDADSLSVKLQRRRIERWRLERSIAIAQQHAYAKSVIEDDIHVPIFVKIGHLENSKSSVWNFRRCADFLNRLERTIAVPQINTGIRCDSLPIGHEIQNAVVVEVSCDHERANRCPKLCSV